MNVDCIANKVKQTTQGNPSRFLLVAFVAVERVSAALGGKCMLVGLTQEVYSNGSAVDSCVLGEREERAYGVSQCIRKYCRPG